jgi:hypothetical protein
VAALSLAHLHRRRGQAAITGVCALCHGRATPQANYHVALSHLRQPGRRWWSCHGNSHDLLAIVTLTLSGCHRAISNSRATAPISYKLSVPSAPLDCQAPNAPTRAFNCSPEPPNCSLPPNRFSASVKDYHRGQRVTGPFPISVPLFQCSDMSLKLIGPTNCTGPG